MSKNAFDKIAAGLNEALGIARGQAEPSKTTFFKFVPVGFAHVWERAGWVATPILNDTHHGVYSVCMTPGPHCVWEDADPVCPPQEAAA